MSKEYLTELREAFDKACQINTFYKGQVPLLDKAFYDMCSYVEQLETDLAHLKHGHLGQVGPRGFPGQRSNMRLCEELGIVDCRCRENRSSLCGPLNDR